MIPRETSNEVNAETLNIEILNKGGWSILHKGVKTATILSKPGGMLPEPLGRWAHILCYIHQTLSPLQQKIPYEQTTSPNVTG